jgi:hypothetical protein
MFESNASFEKMSFIEYFIYLFIFNKNLQIRCNVFIINKNILQSFQKQMINQYNYFLTNIN